MLALKRKDSPIETPIWGDLLDYGDRSKIRDSEIPILFNDDMNYELLEIGLSGVLHLEEYELVEIEITIISNPHPAR